MKYLLDTDICSYIIRKHSRNAIEKLKLIPLGEIGISMMTVCEFELGIQGSEQPERLRKAIEDFLKPFVVLDFQQNDAVEYGKIEFYLMKKGIRIGDFDTLIASQAKARDLILVTNNVKHFKRIPDIQVETWA